MKKIYFRIVDITTAAEGETLANYLGQQDTSGAWAAEAKITKSLRRGS